MTTITVEKADLERLAEFTRNTHWFLENVESLRTKYPDRYIAVFDCGKRIFEAQSMPDLIDKVVKQGENPETGALEFVTKERIILIV
jgi:hypothetical protein